MQISIAIPDSCLADESTQLDKSRKISSIARACAVFRVDTIYVYNEGGSDTDRTLLSTVLKYLEAPPFLRKRLFPRVNELKYAGVLNPLKIPSHVTPTDPKKIVAGDIREGITSSYKGRRFVDVGINRMIPYHGKKGLGKRTIIQFKTGFPDLTIKEIERKEADVYQGYVVRERSMLSGLVSNWEGSIILTSRKGRLVTISDVRGYANSAEPILVAFGSTDKGLHDILGSKIKQMQNSKILNFFPGQATETVRMEEAVFGTLSIIRSGL